MLKNSLINGWNRPTYIIYRKLQLDIVKECKEQNEKNWTKTIQNLNFLHKDLKNSGKTSIN